MLFVRDDVLARRDRLSVSGRKKKRAGEAFSVHFWETSGRAGGHLRELVKESNTVHNLVRR